MPTKAKKTTGRVSKKTPDSNRGAKKNPGSNRGAKKATRKAATKRTRKQVGAAVSTGTRRTRTTSASRKTSTRSRQVQTDTERDQYRRLQKKRAHEDNYGPASESDNRRFKRSKHPEQKNKGRSAVNEHKFGRGAERELLADNRSARKRRMKADRQQYYASQKEEQWPSRGSSNRIRKIKGESLSRGREQDFPGKRYQKGGYGMRDENGYAIRKGTEMYLPGYEDVDRETVETKRRIDLHRGQDEYPSSLTNPNLYGGLPDEDFYETRYRDWYENRARARSGHKNYQGAVPSQTRSYIHNNQNRSERISSELRRQEDRKMLRKTGRSRKGSRSKSAAARHNQIARGWDL